MVEVFKTDVKNPDYGNALVEIIQNTIPGCIANFDLHDCDNILRIQFNSGTVSCWTVIQLLEKFGFNAEVLPDEVPKSKRANKHPFTRTTIAS